MFKMYYMMLNLWEMYKSFDDRDENDKNDNNFTGPEGNTIHTPFLVLSAVRRNERGEKTKKEREMCGLFEELTIT